MEGDRPDFTESSKVVPPRTLQTEGGLTMQKNAPGDHLTGIGELTLRYGVERTIELRAILPNYFHNSLMDGSLSGFSNPLMGFKYQLTRPGPRGEAALIVQTTIPTIEGGDFGSNTSDPELKIPFSIPIGGPWSFNGQASCFYPDVDGERNFRYQQTLSLSYDLSPRSGAFAEYVADYFREGKDALQMHFGYTYKIRPLLQLDVHGGFHLSGGAPDSFIGFGFVTRTSSLRGASSARRIRDS